MAVVEKLMEKLIEKFGEKAVEKAGEQSLREVLEKGGEKALAELLEKGGEKGLSVALRETAEKTLEHTGTGAASNTLKKLTEKPLEQAAENTGKKTTEKTVENATERATEKTTEKTTEKATEKTTEKAAETGGKTLTQKVVGGTAKAAFAGASGVGGTLLYIAKHPIKSLQAAFAAVTGWEAWKHRDGLKSIYNAVTHPESMLDWVGKEAKEHPWITGGVAGAAALLGLSMMSKGGFFDTLLGLALLAGAVMLGYEMVKGVGSVHGNNNNNTHAPTRPQLPAPAGP